ncbi:MAG: oligosaccharide flippase family protein [Candidatus Omnitrophica bacterium]|nr:oligosaccharide flippase family protein [Candidatus Omnitrophota bacterium]
MILKDKFLKNNVLMFFGTALGNSANLLCQILVVKNLSVSGYGAFNSLLSMFMIIALPISAINTMIVKFTAAHNSLGQKKEADLFLFIMLRHMFFVAASFLLLYFLFGNNLQNYLQLDSTLPVYLTGALLFCAIIAIVPQSGLQGFERFTWVSAIAASGGIFKLSFVFLFLSLGWGVTGALTGYVAAQVITMLICFLPLGVIFYAHQPRLAINLKEKYGFVIPAMITLGCVAVLTNMDVILVKHFFSSADAGHYSVAQIIGKIVLFIPSAIPLVMFPSASGLHAQQKESRHLLLQGLKYGALLCLTVVITYNLFPEFILGVLTSKINDQIILLGRLFSVTMTFFSLIGMLLLYQLSTSNFKFLKSLVLLSLLQIVLISAFHASLAQVLSIMLVNSVILFGLNLRSALKPQKST